MEGGKTGLLPMRLVGNENAFDNGHATFGEEKDRGSGAYAAAIRDKGDMGLGCSNGGPRAKEGWARLATPMGRRVPGLGCSRMHIRAGWWAAGVMATAVTQTQQLISSGRAKKHAPAVVISRAEADAVGEEKSVLVVMTMSKRGSNTPAWI